MKELSKVQLINKADEICEFARKIYNEKRSELLRKAAGFYKEATLSFLAEKIEKEADEWDKWWEKGEH